MLKYFLKSCAVILLSLSLVSNCFGAVTLNGDADYIDIGTMGNFGTGLDTNFFIFSIWFNSSNTTSIQCLTGITNDGTATQLYIGLNSNNGTLDAHDIRIFRRDDDGQMRSGTVSLAAGVCDGNWHNLIVASGSTSISVWLDTIAQSVTYNQAGTSDNIANFGYSLFIGANNSRGTPGQFFVGSITEIVIWSSSTVPTTTDISNLYSKIKTIPLQVKISDLTGGYWPLDENPLITGINAVQFDDYSGQGNTGTSVDADGDSLIIGESILSYVPPIGNWQ